MTHTKDTLREADVFQAIHDAMQDERNGKPCGCIIELGCEAAGYIDPESAADSFKAGAVASILALLPQPPEQVKGLVERLLRYSACDNAHCGDSTPCWDCDGCRQREAAAALSSVQNTSATSIPVRAMLDRFDAHRLAVASRRPSAKRDELLSELDTIRNSMCRAASLAPADTGAIPATYSDEQREQAASILGKCELDRGSAAGGRVAEVMLWMSLKLAVDEVAGALGMRRARPADTSVASGRGGAGMSGITLEEGKRLYKIGVEAGRVLQAAEQANFPLIAKEPDVQDCEFCGVPYPTAHKADCRSISADVRAKESGND